MTDSSLSLSLMGTIALRRGGQRQNLHLSGQSRQLFTFLAAHVNQARQRDCIINSIWPDAPRAKAASTLNTAVWRIKKMLAAYDGLSIQSIDSTVRLTVEPPATVDVIVLERAVAEAATTRSHTMRLDDSLREALAATVMDCRGEFLDGCSEHWVLSLREHFGALYIRALSLLMRDEASREDFEAALTYGREILTLDPFREGIQREVMWLYALNGQRARAIQQFNTLKALLNDELGIAPTSDTYTLLKRIIAPEKFRRDDNTQPAIRSTGSASDSAAGSNLSSRIVPPAFNPAHWPR